MSWRGKVHKTYALEKSPFYKIPAPHVLSRLLNINVSRFKRESDLYLKYYKRKIPKNGGGVRITETPYGELRRTHERIFNLLKRISVPQFLHSGIKGRSYISNAQSHKGSTDCFCLDIEKFFPSTTRGHVYDFFVNIALCKADVAAILANICTVDGHLPTGSPLSTLISYFIHTKMFDELDKLAQQHDLTMTVYVDDVVFSGRKISKAFRNKTKLIIHRRGLRSHKHRFYSNNEPKEITGVIVDGEKIRVPQRRHQNLYQHLVSLWNSSGETERRNVFRKTLSRVTEGAQIEDRLGIRRQALMAAKTNIFCNVTARFSEKSNDDPTGPAKLTYGFLVIGLSISVIAALAILLSLNFH